MTMGSEFPWVNDIQKSNFTSEYCMTVQYKGSPLAIVLVQWALVTQGSEKEKKEEWEWHDM